MPARPKGSASGVIRRARPVLTPWRSCWASAMVSGHGQRSGGTAAVAPPAARRSRAATDPPRRAAPWRRHEIERRRRVFHCGRAGAKAPARRRWRATSQSPCQQVGHQRIAHRQALRASAPGLRIVAVAVPPPEILVDEHLHHRSAASEPTSHHVADSRARPDARGAVRAVRGDRASYKPVVSRLCEGSDPVSVAARCASTRLRACTPPISTR